jgi:TPP-dependent pyruvate/acetoin dehydrogenase alpha subunit
VGLALADRKLQRDAITCCFFGEGAMAEGVFHESLNLAALWQVPVLFVCENNQYAMGTALRFSHAMTELERKGPAYGIGSTRVDGMDVLAVRQAANEAINTMRSTRAPHLLVCDTYRFRAHSMFDAELYRDKAEVEEWRKRDPITAFTHRLQASNSIDPPQIRSMESEVKGIVDQAITFAENGTWEPVEDLLRSVTSSTTTT